MSKTSKQIQNIIRDGNIALLAGFIPILGLVFIIRLVHWYQLKPKVESLKQRKAIKQETYKKFKSAGLSIWVGVLLWPVVILTVVIYLLIT
jgi:uncharacterized membrane protein